MQTVSYVTLKKIICELHQLVVVVVVVVVMTSLSGTAYMGGQNVPKRRGNPPDSKSRGICLSLVIVDSHFVDWGTTRGRLSLPTADVLSNDRC